MTKSKLNPRIYKGFKKRALLLLRERFFKKSAKLSSRGQVQQAKRAYTTFSHQYG